MAGTASPCDITVMGFDLHAFAVLGIVTVRCNNGKRISVANAVKTDSAILSLSGCKQFFTAEHQMLSERMRRQPMLFLLILGLSNCSIALRHSASVLNSVINANTGYGTEDSAIAKI